ncbi:MAG TPA: aminotransferase class V-fold PLP-dependent enzyme, partial [Anaerolineaceae bacterium]|nr:aminotransferase class V-fold PLP-dependent enzyme [Anaerolineaceae bacterium]
MARDILSARQDFPILDIQVNDRPLVYLDNAATTQKPQVVIDTLRDYYTRYNANIHRGNYAIAYEATEAYEKARAKVAGYINAEHKHEIIFTRGTTESINLVAYSFGERFVGEGDEIIVTQLEHHSNYVPWKLLCERKKATFRVVPFDENGDLDLEVYKSLLNEKTRVVAVNHVSNSLGTINPVKEIIQLAHNAGAVVLVDAAQAVQHIEHDVQALDADFYAFSGHKMYGPMGVGVLYGKEKWLDAMPPFLSGGEMISNVTPEKISFNVLPYKFEAGTPNVPGPIGLAAAIDYLQEFD